MGFYSSLGFLVFGSRLRRLSEYFLMEVNKVYEQAGIPFEASWFPVFYLLGREQPMPLIDIAAQLEVSHSAISQLVNSLKKKGLVNTAPCPDDGRRQLVMLTRKGEELLQQVQPVWAAITKAMNELADEKILHAVSAMEKNVQEEALASRIQKQLK